MQRQGIDGRLRPEWITRPESGGIRSIRWVVRLALALGRRAARVAIFPVCVYFVLFSPAERTASRGYLRRALGRAPRLTDLLRHFHAFSVTLLDRIYLLKGQFGRYDVRTHGEEVVMDMAQQGQGCLLLGAHLGSFEILRFLGTQGRGLPVSLVMYEDNSRNLNAVLQAIDPECTIPVIALGKIESMLKVEEALAGGGCVGILADRTIEGEGTLTCAFLGTPARFPAGPFRLAAMLKRPAVLMLGLYRGGNRYDVFFERLFDPSTLKRAERAAAIEQAVRLYVARLDHYCRLAPYNWFNFYDYWHEATVEHEISATAAGEPRKGARGA